MATKAKTVTEVLKAAKWMLENVGWCQGTYVKNNNAGKITAFCAAGAIETVNADVSLIDKALNRFGKVVGEGYIPNWNDASGRTLPQVLKAFDKAIKAKQ